MDTSELISMPYIPPRKRNERTALKSKKSIDPTMDPRFDPTTMADLSAEAEKFFGQDLPFWSLPIQRRLSVALSLPQKEPVRFNVVPAVGMWNRFILAFKTKQKLLHSLESNPRRRSTEDLFNQSAKTDEIFYDCVSLQKSHSFDSVEF